MLVLIISFLAKSAYLLVYNYSMQLIHVYSSPWLFFLLWCLLEWTDLLVVRDARVNSSEKYLRATTCPGSLAVGHKTLIIKFLIRTERVLVGLPTVRAFVWKVA